MKKKCFLVIGILLIFILDMQVKGHEKQVQENLDKYIKEGYTVISDIQNNKGMGIHRSVDERSKHIYLMENDHTY